MMALGRNDNSSNNKNRSLYINIRKVSAENEDNPPELLPPITMSAEHRPVVKHSPLYINQASITRNEEMNINPSESDGAATPVPQGTLLAQKCTETRDDLSYSTCNGILHATASVNNRESVLESINPSCPESSIERGGYVQPAEVFCNLHDEEINTYIDDGIIFRKHHNSLQKDRTKRKDGYESEDGMKEICGYISPTDQEIPGNGSGDGEYLGLAVSPCIETDIDTCNKTQTRRNLHRFDSGFEDNASVKGSNPSTPTEHGTFRNRLSTCVEQHYEDIDFYLNEKKAELLLRGCESTNRVAACDNIPVSRDPSLTSRNRRPSHNLSHSHHCVTETTTKRCANQENPNQVLVRSDSTYMSTGVSSKLTRATKRRECFLLTLVLLLLFVVSVVSLGISIYTLLLQRSEPNQRYAVVERSEIPRHSVNESDKRVSEWSPKMAPGPTDSNRRLDRLRHELIRLEKENAAHKQAIQEKDDNIRKSLDELKANQKSIALQMETISSDVNTQIANISSTLMFQRHSDVSHLASCKMEYSSYTRTEKRGRYEFINTSFEPSEGDLENNVLLFAFCTHKSMMDVSLDLRTTHSHTQYRCRCQRRVDAGRGIKECTINYWICPIR